MVVSVQTIVTSCNTIRVQKRNYLELVFLQQKASLFSFRHQEVNNTIKYMRALHLTRMDSRRQKYCRFVILMASDTTKDL